MPDRIIRDELLDSDRYNELSSDSARLLFVHFLLVADDLGNCEATARFIRKRLLCHPVSDEAIAKLIGELCDADLIRAYQVDDKRYVHIPRFRQRLRSYRRTNPRPPAEVECNEIKHLLGNLSDKCPTADGQLTGICQSPAGEGREGRKRKEVKEVKEENAREEPVDNSGAVATVTHALASKLKKNGNTGAWWKTETGIAAKGAELGMPARNGEQFSEWKSRLFDELKRRGQS